MFQRQFAAVNGERTLFRALLLPIEYDLKTLMQTFFPLNSASCTLEKPPAANGALLFEILSLGIR
jgi:hypothetical protein